MTSAFRGSHSHESIGDACVLANAVIKAPQNNKETEATELKSIFRMLSQGAHIAPEVNLLLDLGRLMITK